jgi:hypothetical protein
MSFKFSDTRAHRYRTGQIFIGLDPKTGHEIGISTERHAITAAGARSGKGAGLIIPNLLRWPHNVLHVDPSGENVAASWEAREAMGQQVGALDPFQVANIPDRLRVSCNLLAAINPKSLTAREDALVVADGLVRRYDPQHGQWDNKVVELLAGTVAFVRLSGEPHRQTLLDVRAILNLPDDALGGVFQLMTELPDSGGLSRLARAAGNIGLASLKNPDKSPTGSAVGGAREHTSWIDSDGMEAALGDSDFNLSALKTGNCSLFLVIPSDYLVEHGRFLRLFVRCALNAMGKGGKVDEPNTGDGKINRRCLFILDEFFSLGRVDEIAVAAGQMPKNGVHLWPFLQDLGQLLQLYGPNGADTFFSNSDAHIFFGNTDATTLKVISAGIGALTMQEIGPAPTHVRSAPMQGHGVASFLSAGSNNPHVHGSSQMMGGLVAGTLNSLSALGDWAAQHEANEWQIKASRVGQSRLAPDEVRELVAKKDGDRVARSMIVFGKGGDVFNLKLAPYFEARETEPDGPALAVRFNAPPILKAAVVGMACFYAPILPPALLVPDGAKGPFVAALYLASYAAMFWWVVKSEKGKKLRQWVRTPYLKR